MSNELKVGDLVIIKSRDELNKLRDGDRNGKCSIWYNHFYFENRECSIKYITNGSGGDYKIYRLSCSSVEWWSDDMFNKIEKFEKKDFSIKKFKGDYLLTDFEGDKLLLTKEDLKVIEEYSKDYVDIDEGELKIKMLGSMINLIKNGDVISLYKKEIPKIRKCLK